MKCSSQPTLSYPRYQSLTVAEVMEVLAKAPPDAVIGFKDGGTLQAKDWAPWKEIEIVERPGRKPLVKTCWE